MAKPSPWNWMVPVVDDSKRATKEFLFWLTGALGTARTAEDALDEAEEAKELAQQALDTKVSKSGDTMTGDLQVPDEAYGPSWNGSAEVPTKNAIYDALQDVSGSISVAKDDTVVVSDVTELNFEGSGIASVTDDGDGKATVTIEGGGSTPSPIWEVTDTGTGSSQNVTIPVSVTNEEDILVFVNGIRYPTSDFSVSGTTVALTTNSFGDDIRVLGVYNGGSSGGGGSGAVYIATLGPGSTITSQTVIVKGALFSPEVDITNITTLWFEGTVAVGDKFVGYIVGVSSSGTITSIVATTDETTITTASALGRIRCDFSTPASVTAGTSYALLCKLTTTGNWPAAFQTGIANWSGAPVKPLGGVRSNSSPAVGVALTVTTDTYVAALTGVPSL